MLSVGESPERYLTVKEAAEVYFQGKVSAREVYVLFSLGEIRGFRVGGKILIYLSSLNAYREKQENGKHSPPPPVPPAPPGTTPKIRLNRLPE